MKVTFYWFVCLYACTLLARPHPVIATEGSASLQQQRKLFQLTVQALQTNQQQPFFRYKSQLQQYPLHSYLDYLYLRHRFGQISPDRILRFLEKNADTFYGRRLRQHWLDYLARKKRWSLFLRVYREPQSVSRQCLRLQALIATRQDEQLFRDVVPLWLSSRSQHKACDPVFDYWNKKQRLTDDLRRQRIMLALYDNQFSLADYLAKSLARPRPARQLIHQWRQAHLDPDRFLQAHPDVPPSFHKREILKHALKRLAYQDPERAYHYWQQLTSKFRLREENKWLLKGTIATQAALNHNPQALLYFADLPNAPWRVRAALWQQDWRGAVQALNSLNHDLAQKAIWQYWLARALTQLKQPQPANIIYQRLAAERDFYGFMAADILRLPYQMNHRPVQYQQQELKKLSARTDVQRLKEFFALGMLLEARRQAYALQQKLSKKELQLLAHLTHQWNWHHQTIAFLGKARYWDALDLRFPLVFDHSIIEAGQEYGLDPSWLLAIARQESAFNTKAHSPAGALGLMQLMPATGKLIARLINQPLKRKSELLRPERNIQLGSAYLHRLYQQYQRNPVLATAAYNAGPNRVARWLPSQSMPADIWIENIPYRETRRYVKNVLSYSAIFDYQRKKTIQPLTTRMPAIVSKKQ